MAKRVFEIEWKDSLGPTWMNKGNLDSCLFTDWCCAHGLCDSSDVTDEIASLRAKVERVELAIQSVCDEYGEHGLVKLSFAAQLVRAALADAGKG